MTPDARMTRALKRQPRPGWHREANCADTPVAVMFPINAAQTRRALEHCDDCPVSDDCLTDALEFEIDVRPAWIFGVRAGLTHMQRRQFVRRHGNAATVGRRHQPKPPCGTRRAYFWHRRRGEPTCVACREANREYLRQHREAS